MSKNNPWETLSRKTLTPIKHKLAYFSVKVRSDQFNIFKDFVMPTENPSVLDVGATSNEILPDSNMFEKLYKYPDKLTAATIEDAKTLRKFYPAINVVKVKPIKEGIKLPFKNKQFDIVVSWATLEHVGSYRDQEYFLNELLRVGKKIFVTIPYRGCIYEPHSGFFFLHWLPLWIFRKICKFTGREFWSYESYLNPLYRSDIYKMKLIREVDIILYRMFKIIPSHLIIISRSKNSTRHI
jgi:hypothetical protein